MVFSRQQDIAKMAPPRKARVTKLLQFNVSVQEREAVELHDELPEPNDKNTLYRRPAHRSMVMTVQHRTLIPQALSQLVEISGRPMVTAPLLRVRIPSRSSRTACHTAHTVISIQLKD